MFSERRYILNRTDLTFRQRTLLIKVSLYLCVKSLHTGTITQPEDEWGLRTRVLCVCERVDGSERTDGDREEEHRDSDKWFSRWDLICETMHPKETFSHGSSPWIQIHPTAPPLPPHPTTHPPPPALHRKDRCTLLQPVVERRSLYFIFSRPITKLEPYDFTAAPVSHPFIPFIL